MAASVKQLNDEIRHPGIQKHKKKNGTLIYVDVVTHDLSFNGRDARLLFLPTLLNKKRPLRPCRRVKSDIVHYSTTCWTALLTAK